MESIVILLNFGGPRNTDEVQTFLFEILRDPNTIQLPVPGWLQDVFAHWIAARRAPETARQYGEIGGRSTIVEDTHRIARALEAALAKSGCRIPVMEAQRPHHGLGRRGEWRSGGKVGPTKVDPGAAPVSSFQLRQHGIFTGAVTRGIAAGRFYRRIAGAAFLPR